VGFSRPIKTIVYAILIALVVRTVAYEPFNIPSGSMIPTLLVGDYLFVSKFSYGYSRFSLPFGLPLFSGRILEFHHPERGDVGLQSAADRYLDRLHQADRRPARRQDPDDPRPSQHQRPDGAAPPDRRLRLAGRR
jgi:signal peptidase I